MNKKKPMKRILIVLMMMGLVACTRKADKPKGPYAALISRLPVNSELVVLVNWSAFGQVVHSLMEETLTVPMVAANKGFLKLVKEQQSLMRSLVTIIHSRNGLHLSKDIQRAGLGMVFTDPDGLKGLLVLEGKFRPSLQARLQARGTRVQLSKRTAYRLKDRLLLALVDNRHLLIGDTRSVTKALASDELDGRISLKHPGVFLQDRSDLLLNVSQSISPAMKEYFRRKKGLPGVSVLMGIKRVSIHIGQKVDWRVECANRKTALGVRDLLESHGHYVLASHHGVRGLLLLALALNYEKAPQVAAWVSSVFKNKPALIESIDFLLPKEIHPPVLSIEGKLVRRTGDLNALKGAWTLLGGIGAAMVPTILRYVL
jgi:hypothetical protein